MISDQLISAWNRCLDVIGSGLSAEQFNAWFKPITPVGYDHDTLRVMVPSEYFCEMIEGNYLMVFKSALREVFGSNVKLIYEFPRVASDDATVTAIPSDDSALAVREQLRSHPGSNDPFDNSNIIEDIDPQLNFKYTFENYCGSESNKLPLAVARAIAARPEDKTYNPLFIFGSTGVGKTHLIQAVGIKIKEQNPHARVLYLTARIFEHQFTTARLQNKIPDFINFYQSIDVLLLDDIHELAGKVATQNTFFHIFNHLHQHQRQLIMTSDSRPSELEGLVPRLLSRFKWGMTVELAKPDYKLRREVLEMRAAQDGIVIDTEVLDFIAQNVTESIRDLEGIMVSLLGHAAILDSDINMELARSVISNTVKLNERQVTLDYIAQVIADYYNLDPDLLFAKSRKREISDARQLLMYMAKNVAKMSSTTIGLRLSRDHSTVLHAIKQVEQRLATDHAFANDVDQINAQLK